MISRFRLLAALLALFAFFAYFAEGVWASACPPGMQTAGANMAPATPAGDACPMAAQHAAEHTPGAPDHSEHPGDEAPRCPLHLAGAGGSCASVSLPAVTGEALPSLQESAILSPSPDAARDLLLAAMFFRPPIR